MDDEMILNKLKIVLNENFQVDPDEVVLSSDLTDDLGLDSVDIMDSIFFVEDAFNIKLIKEDEGARENIKLDTVLDIISLIKEKAR